MSGSVKINFKINSDPLENLNRIARPFVTRRIHFKQNEYLANRIKKQEGLIERVTIVLKNSVDRYEF
jgi:hypothetical protein